MVDLVMTVTGPVDVEDLGLTLMHEHIFLDLMRDAWIFTNLLNDPKLANIELDLLRQAGGATVVDLTSGGLREYDNPIMFEQESLAPLPPPLAVRRAAEQKRSQDNHGRRLVPRELLQTSFEGPVHRPVGGGNHL